MMIRFYLTFFALVVFAFGVGNFSLGIWIYQSTGSIAAFTMVGISSILPAFILTPFAGWIVDRIRPRRAIQYSSIIMAAAWLVVVAMLYAGMTIVYLLPPLVVMGAFMALQAPAYHTMIAESVPAEKLTQVNGLFGTVTAVANICSPFVAGFLVGTFNIYIIGLLPFAALAVQALALATMAGEQRLSRPEGASLLADLWRVFRYLVERRDVLLLLVLGLFINTFSETAGVVVTPLGLELFDERRVGLLVTVAGVGALVGNVVLTALPDLKQKISLILAINLVQGILLIVLTQSSMAFLLIASAMAMFFAFEAVYDGVDLAYWQERAPEDMRAK